jgi:hypothetical protein
MKNKNNKTGVQEESLTRRDREYSLIKNLHLFLYFYTIAMVGHILFLLMFEIVWRPGASCRHCFSKR